MELIQPTDKEIKQLALKNKMLNVLENRGSQIAVVGDTSTGKSTTINFLLGFPVNFEAAGIGTRRPCVICQEYKEDAKTVQFNVTFTKGGDVINQACSHVYMVRDLVTKANSPKYKEEYFDCIAEYRKLNNGQKIPDGHIFDAEPIYVTMYHDSFKLGLRLIDLPGLTRHCDAPLHIAEKYIQPGNVVMLVIGRDQASNVQFPRLAGKMADCSKVIFMQNFATKVLDGISNNIAEIKAELKKNGEASNDPVKMEKCNTLAANLVLYLTEYGYPCNDDTKGAGLWDERLDQLDWIEESRNKSPETVRDEMWGHADMRAKKITRENPQIVKDKIKAGLQEPLNELIKYQLDDLPNQIEALRKWIQTDIKEKKELVEKLEKKAQALNNPPEWHAMIACASQTVSKFLDTTIEVRAKNYEATGRDYNKPNEPLTSFEGQDTRGEVFMVGTGGPSCTWTGKEEIDRKIIDCLSQHGRFEADQKLLCLKSWVRLLDEFTAMLAFAPMNTISENKKKEVLGTVKLTITGKADPAIGLIELLCIENTDKENKNLQPIRWHLKFFKQRLMALMERDMKYAMQVFAKDETEVITNFLEAIGVDDDRKQAEGIRIVQEVKETIIEECAQLIIETIDGVKATTYDQATGRWIQAKVHGRDKYEEKSGLAIREKENTPIEDNAGLVHWIFPFKSHYLNGQIPWRDLAWVNADTDTTGQGVIAPTVGPSIEPLPPGAKDVIKKPLSDDLKSEIVNESLPHGKFGQLNFVSGMNLRIYDLCTRMYDVDLKIGSVNKTDFELEALKLLKAMQAEVASFWAFKQMSLVQSLFNKDAISLFLKDHAQKLFRKDKVLIYEKEGIEKAIEETLTILVGSESGMDSRGYFTGTGFTVAETTTEELTKLGQHMASNPEKYKGRNSPWNGGMTREKYLELLKERGDLVPDGCRTKFPATWKEQYACRQSWVRICEEFLFLILQLSMRSVTEEEVSLAKASTGDSLTASPQEIVGKLVLHRLREVGKEGGTNLMDRMSHVYERDVSAGLEQAKELGIDQCWAQHTVCGRDGMAFMKEGMHLYCMEMLSECNAAVNKAFDQLRPFDWSTLNGRLPLVACKECCRANPYVWVGGDEDGELKQEDKTAELEETLTAPIQGLWKEKGVASLEGKMFVGVVGENGKPANENNPTVTCSEAVQKEAFQNLVVDPFGAIVSGVGEEGKKEYRTKPPKEDGYPELLAPPRFQEVALAVWKAMHCAAIDYCRPKLKKLLAGMYNVDAIRKMLEEAPTKPAKRLDFRTLYKDEIEATQMRYVEEKGKLQKLTACEQALNEGNAEMMDDPMSEADQLALDHGNLEDQKNQAERKRKEIEDALAEQAREAAAQRDAEYARIQASEANYNQLRTLVSGTKPFATMGDKYLALDTMSSQYKMKIDNFSLSRADVEEKQSLSFVGYYYKVEGWWGEHVDVLQPPRAENIKSYQHLFDTSKFSARSMMRGGLEVNNKSLDNNLSSAEGTYKVVSMELPPLFPWHEHFICIECFVSEKGSMFNGDRPPMKVFHVIIPCAYVLHPSNQPTGKPFLKPLNDLWQKIENFSWSDKAPFKREGTTFQFKSGKGLVLNEVVMNYGNLRTNFSRAEFEITLRIECDENDFPLINMVDSAQVTEAGEYTAGMDVEYLSQRQRKWYRTKITQVNPSDGSVMVAIKAGQWISKSDASVIIRLPGQQEQAAAAAVAPQASYNVGDKVQYYSRGMQKWLPTEITFVHPDGSVETKVKPGFKISLPTSSLKAA